MTPEQLQTIKAMKLTRSDIQAVAQEWGVATNDGGQPGAGANLTEEERAARRVYPAGQWRGLGRRCKHGLTGAAGSIAARAGWVTANR